MRKLRLLAFVIALAIFMPLMCITAFADTQPVFEIGQVTAQGGKSVSVPLTLSDNTVGICGATLTVAYDSKLTLVDVEQGEALSSLTMTKPGNMNANPVNIVWDGMEANTSNGVIAYLTFTAPNEAGSYPITLSYVDGDILDGSVSAIDAVVISGAVTVSEGTVETGPTIKVGTVSASAGEAVNVPISISSNTGLCGATITVTYDKMLTLTGIKQGEALSSLNMTKPGNMSENPVNILWDGMEADTSNGVIANLTFTAPSTSGTYPIKLSYIDGDILDGNVLPVDVTLIEGAIIVGSSNNVTVTASGKSVTLTNNSASTGKILIAYYANSGKMLSLELYEPTVSIEINNPNSEASRLKVMWWKDTTTFSPLCDTKEISLK